MGLALLPPVGEHSEALERLPSAPHRARRVFWGADDTWIPAAKGRELASRIPGARLEEIPGAGHLVQEDAPAELTAGLISFFRSLDR